MRFIHVELRVKSEKAALYEETFEELKKLVRENEPGCRLFELARDADEPHLYHVLEAYDDLAAIEDHAATDYYLRTADVFVECIEGGHMEEIQRRGLKGREMYSVINNIDFMRLDTL